MLNDKQWMEIVSANRMKQLMQFKFINQTNSSVISTNSSPFSWINNYLFIYDYNQCWPNKFNCNAIKLNCCLINVWFVYFHNTIISFDWAVICILYFQWRTMKKTPAATSKWDHGFNTKWKMHAAKKYCTNACPSATGCRSKWMPSTELIISVKKIFKNI